MKASPVHNIIKKSNTFISNILLFCEMMYWLHATYSNKNKTNSMHTTIIQEKVRFVIEILKKYYSTNLKIYYHILNQKKKKYERPEMMLLIPKYGAQFSSSSLSVSFTHHIYI